MNDHEARQLTSTIATKATLLDQSIASVAARIVSVLIVMIIALFGILIAIVNSGTQVSCPPGTAQIVQKDNIYTCVPKEQK